MEEENSLAETTLQMLKLINSLYQETMFPFLYAFIEQNFFKSHQERSQAIFVLNSITIEETKHN